MSECARNIRIPDFSMTGLRILPSSMVKLRNIQEHPQQPKPHITLCQASRPSTASASGAFAAGSQSSVIKEKHRVVFMGSAFVGKTQIVSQFLYDKFSGRYRQTIEELHRGEYELDNSSLTLDILDTSGAYSFPAMRELSINTSNAFILVYSIDSEESWKEVSRLRDKVSS